jgi:hypothetical protein
MEDKFNRMQPQWKKTSMEEDLCLTYSDQWELSYITIMNIIDPSQSRILQVTLTSCQRGH